MQMTPSQSTSQSGPSDWPDGAMPKRWIDSLFERMELSYGEKFTRQWGSLDPHKMKRFWAQELGQLTPEQLKTGVTAMKTAEWPPTLPEFVAMCQPPFDYSAALQEAVEQIHKRDEGRDEWSNPAIYWAAIKIGRFDLLNVPHKELLKRFTKAMEKILAQETIDPVPPKHDALPAPGKAVANKERVEAEMKKIRAIQNVGNKDWAKRILERAGKGEKLAFMTVKMAKQAMGIKDDSR